MSPASKAPHARLTVLYVVALSTVALLSIGAQALIQWQLTRGGSDSSVINIAGRQRMLSQRLAKAAVELSAAPPQQQAASLSELTDTHKLWTRSHLALREGGDLGLPGHNSQQVQELFDAIDANYNAMTTAAAALESADTPEQVATHVAAIQENEGAFLAGMDAIVLQYVAEAEAKVARLRRLEMALLGLTLAVLLIEGVCIFRPAVQRIQQTSNRLRQARDDAQAASRAKSRFLANVSHELRTPMTAVLSATELAQQSAKSEQKNEYLGMIADAGGMLLSLLNELIDFAQIEAGRLELKSAPFSPGQVAESVVRMMRISASGHSVAVVSESSGDVGVTLLGDPHRVSQVLLNLMSNGLKWTDAGSVTLATHVESIGDDRVRVRYVVRDTGTGIPKSQQDRIFAPFEQGSQHKHRGGVGLGLAICRRIAESMRGLLTLESVEGQGTTVTFQVDLPRADALPHQATADPPRLIPQTAQRVLVVEDNPLSLRVLEDVLQHAGHQVHVCSTGEQGVAAFGQQSFDVVITDRNLPGISGVEAARQMRAMTPPREQGRMRFIALSADAGGADDLDVYDAVLTKPFRSAELLSAIESATHRSPTHEPDDPQLLRSDLLDELAVAYLEIGPASRQRLQAAIAAEDWRQAYAVSHQLKGQVGYFGDTSLLLDLGMLETACETAAGENVTELARTILSKLERLEKELSDRVSGKPTAVG